jgi:hypothetical protein
MSNVAPGPIVKCPIHEPYNPLLFSEEELSFMRSDETMAQIGIKLIILVTE